MATRPALTNEVVALTEQKMKMSLDDIIKMSKKPVSKGKNARMANKNRDFIKNGTSRAQARASNLKRFMNSRSTIRQGVLAQKRSNFKVNSKFSLEVEAAPRIASIPVAMRFPIAHTPGCFNSRSLHALRRPMAMIQRSPENASTYAAKMVPAAVQKHGSQTLDSLFANMKEHRLQRVGTTAPNGQRVGRRAQFPHRYNLGNYRNRPSQ